MRNIVGIPMPSGLDILIGKIFANITGSEGAAKIDDPLEMKVRSVEIRRFVPGHTVIFRRQTDKQKNSEKQSNGNGPARFGVLAYGAIHHGHRCHRQRVELVVGRAPRDKLSAANMSMKLM